MNEQRQAEVLEQLSRALDKIEAREEARLEAERRKAEADRRMAERLEKLETSVHSTAASEPGLAMRIMLLEQTISRATAIATWMGGGGLAGLATVVWLLWYIGGALRPPSDAKGRAIEEILKGRTVEQVERYLQENGE